MKRTIQVQEQVLMIDGSWTLDARNQKEIGYCICPYCKTRNRVVSYNNSTLYADELTACSHNCGAVDAGGLRVAIHFQSDKEINV